MKPLPSDSIKYQSGLHRAIVGLVSIGLVASLAIGVSTAGAQTYTRQYTMTDLGVLPAKKAAVSIPAAINDQGQVTGTSGMADVDESAFLYDPKQNKGGMEDLGRNAAGISHGFAMDSIGDVVGDSLFDMGVTHAALFKSGKIVDLGTLPGFVNSRATGINSSGLVVGYATAKPEESSTDRAFVRSAATGMIDIGTLGGESAQAFGINDAGFVTGTAQVHESVRREMTHAFIYQPLSIPGRSTRRMVDLGTLGGNDSYGMAINANNHIAGYSTLNGGIDRIHAFLYDGVKMRDLGSLDATVSGNDQSYGLAINILDEVVGYTYIPSREGDNGPGHPTKQTAFIYTQGMMMELNGLVMPVKGQQYWLKAATAINNNGQIVAIAEDMNTLEIHAVLLTH